MSAPLLAISWTIVALTTLLAVRLGRAAHRDRSLPEALIAAFFVTGGPLGYGVLLLRSTFGLSMEAYAPLLAITHTTFLVPVLAVVVFTWRVFRPSDAWARGLAWSLVALVVGIHVAGWGLSDALGWPSARDPGSAPFWLSATLRAIGFGWACLEAVLFYAKAQRRRRVGLGDPLVANRFGLWAIWSGAAFAILVFRSISPFVVDASVDPPLTPPWLVVVQMVSGIVCAVAIWLTFAPPRPYRRWIGGESAA